MPSHIAHMRGLFGKRNSENVVKRPRPPKIYRTQYQTRHAVTQCGATLASASLFMQVSLYFFILTNIENISRAAANTWRCHIL
jgi:hypothetical protein